MPGASLVHPAALGRVSVRAPLRHLLVLAAVFAGCVGASRPAAGAPVWASERGIFRREWGYAGNDAVGIRPAGASPYCLLDTGGNMWEWCEDWYAPHYYESSPRDKPDGATDGTGTRGAGRLVGQSPNRAERLV